MNLPPLDSVRPAAEDWQQALMGALLDVLAGPYAMLFAFLDESGTHETAPAMCVAGVLYDRKAMKLLDSVWRKELAAAGVRYFHAVDCAHRKGEFKGTSPESADVLYRKLIAALSKFAFGTVTLFSIPRDFEF